MLELLLESKNFAFHQLEEYDNKKEVGKIGMGVLEFCSANVRENLDQVVLLDSGSTVDLFKNKKLLKNIRSTKISCQIKTNDCNSTTITDDAPPQGHMEL